MEGLSQPEEHLCRDLRALTEEQVALWGLIDALFNESDERSIRILNQYTDRWKDQDLQQ